MIATHVANTDTCSYSSQAVSRATGIPVTTILAWERRYGIPCPGRAPNGRRRYSEADVKLLLAMRTRTAAGMRAEVAARELRDAPAAPTPVVPAPVRRPQLMYVPTVVQEVRCLHCGDVAGELLTQRTADGSQTRFVLAPHGSAPRRGPGGRPDCGRCGGALYRESSEHRALPPLLGSVQTAPMRATA